MPPIPHNVQIPASIDEEITTPPRCFEPSPAPLASLRYYLALTTTSRDGAETEAVAHV